MDLPQLCTLITTFLRFSVDAAIFTLAVCTALHYLIYIRTVRRWEKANIPLLRPMFLFGHKYFCNLGRHSSYLALDRIYRENADKDVVAFFMMTTPVVLLKDTKLIQQVFAKNFDKAYQTGFTMLKSDVEAQSFLPVAADKKVWKNGRALMAPVFSKSRLCGAPEFAAITKQIQKLLKLAEKAELSGQPLDVDEATTNFAFDGMCLWAFGKDLDSFRKKEELYEMIRYFGKPSYMTVLKFLILNHFPWLQVFDAFRFINRKYVGSVGKLLAEQMALRNEGSFDQNDVVDHFIALKEREFVRLNEEDSSETVEKNEGLSFRRLIGYGLSVIIPSTLPPAMTTAYTLHLLSLHPEHQKKIKGEIDEVMMKHQVTEFTPDVIKDLQFAEQCVLEAARLYPTAALIARHCTDDIRIPGTSFTINKGDRVIVNPYSMQRDPKYFKDPDKFHPERFSPENGESISPETFLAFGYGPRKCPAFKQGIFMTVTCVASLLHKYDVLPHSHLKQMDAMDFDPRSPVNHHKESLLVKLVRRKVVTSEI